jgi:electron transport complex protein RnfC
MKTHLPAWGIRFPRPSAESGGLELVDAPLPAVLTVALHQNIGFPAEPLVRTGDTVLRGQPLGEAAATGPSARVHSPSSGFVREIAELPVPGRGAALCVVIETDGNDTPWPGYEPVDDPLHLPTSRLRKAIAEAGIVGLGGAMFPTTLKLNPGLGVSTLILNGVECEPRINCDDALMQHEADRILEGARIMMRILEADNCKIAIKESTSAVRTMRAALTKFADDRFEITTVPALYPMGGEAQLIELLTGIEVPSDGLPWDTGTICHNVGTAAAIATYVRDGKPLIERIVTVSGAGVNRPVNVRARIGTPISTLIDTAGGYTEDAGRLIMGGPMMGIALASDELPLTKACNSIFVAGRSELATPETSKPCIRCGECAVVCPVRLTPQLLLTGRETNNLERLESLGLSQCIECGCCDYVCPSRIPLTQTFRKAKEALWERGFEQRRARRAEQRISARQKRLQNEAVRQQRDLDSQTETLVDTTAQARDALQELLQRTGRDQEDKDS